MQKRQYKKQPDLANSKSDKVSIKQIPGSKAQPNLALKEGMLDGLEHKVWCQQAHMRQHR